MNGLALLLVLLCFMSVCERRTEVRVEGGNPPRFVLKGSGRLGELIIFGPEQESTAQSDPFDETYALWKIEPQEEGESGAALVEELHVVSYGVVPPGYRQVKPEAGAPAKLESNKRYGYWFVTVNAPHAAGYFEIHDGKAVPVEGP